MQILHRLALAAFWALAAVGIVCGLVGDVVSLRGELTDNLMTHRVEMIQPEGDGGWMTSTRGGENELSDALDLTVTVDVWKPAAQHGGWGTAILRMGAPGAALPLVIGLIGLLGLALIPAPAANVRRRAGIARAESAAT